MVGRVKRNGIEALTGTLPCNQRAVPPEALKPHFCFATNPNHKAVDHLGRIAAAVLGGESIKGARAASSGRRSGQRICGTSM